METFDKQLDTIASVSPLVADCIKQELADQRSYLKLIASENYSSPAVQAAMGTLLTDKYAEGFVGHRYYAGCKNIDRIESQGNEDACKLFGAEHAYLQPHSGADANLCAYMAVLKSTKLSEHNINKMPREVWNLFRRLCHEQKLLGMDYYSGGHLTHGYRVNASAMLFDAHSYTVGDNGLLDYDKIRRQAKEIRPLILLAGYSAYPRKVNFKIFREIADECGAVLMVDMAHFAGLVAGKVFTGEFDPVPYADIVTTTTHKTLRGPRGGMILCKDWLADAVDKSCPTVIGGPLPNMVAAKVVALEEALKPEFHAYAENIVKNAQTLADTLKEQGIEVLTGGTDNHMVIVDVSYLDTTGREAEKLLRKAGITCNRNTIPCDPKGPWHTSGLRLGTAAVTTLGMGTDEMKEIGNIVADTLKTGKADASKVHKLLKDFPLYPEFGGV